MGILTKHLLEPVVPPRQRRPELQIPPDVEAVCLRALEKDREKRWADMDALYRALGAAGQQPFEPRPASLKYPSLAQPDADMRESKAALAAMPPAGTFDDERPSRPEAVGGGLGARARLALGAAAALAIVLVVVVALRGRPAPGPAAVAGDRVDPLRRKVDVPGDPTTPAELQNPFAAP
jgi:eukaryotic-like serine/threonine-protein kinase